MIYSIVWPILGVVLIVAAVGDFYCTTITMNGSGPLSKWLARGTWVSLLRANQLRTSHRLLSFAGPCVLLLLILMWFGLCWLGWFLIFCGSESSVVSAKTEMPATAIERLYYAGYTFTTIGYGDFKAPNPAGQVVSIVGGLNGLFLVTLAITYSIPVVSSSVDKRKLSKGINVMGESPAEIIDTTRGNGDFEYLESQLQRITSDVMQISEKHFAYPILHYFHAADPKGALPLNLARLNEALMVISYAFPDVPAKTRIQIDVAQKAIGEFMDVLHRDFIRGVHGRSKSPPAPNCKAVQSLQHSPKSVADVEKFLATQPVRNLLYAYIQSDGWKWGEVENPDIHR